MNDRKQHVLKMAQQLFIEKGFQASSIQDILEYSGISKGTFYNYFSSKNELLMAIIKSVYEKMQNENRELLIGQDPSDIDIFIKQIEQQLKINRKNRLISLVEEVVVSDDAELNQFIKEWQLTFLQWIFTRFLDIFPESSQPYLLDCAIMFSGILHYNLKYYGMAFDSNLPASRVVQYSVERVIKIVKDVSEADEQLIPPDYLERMLPGSKKRNHDMRRKLHIILAELKKNLPSGSEHALILDFIEEELLHTGSPRKYLIDSVMSSLKTANDLINLHKLRELEEMITAYFI